MENQTRFNLSAVIENWRQELAAEPNLTPVVRNELETHLRDTIAEFQKRGLNDEESFWLARRRIGPPQPLAREFLKANPAAIWRERLMWMAIAMLFVSQVHLTTSFISVNVVEFSQMRQPNWQTVQAMSSVFVDTALIIVAVRLLLRGPVRVFPKLALLFRSRSRFLVASIGWVMLNASWVFYRAGGLSSHPGVSRPGPWTSLVLTSFWPLALIVLIAWLMGTEQGRAKKGHWPAHQS